MATLHIIGNGFDIHHGIASLYSDFREYAWEHSGSDGYWLGQLETCYPTKNKKNGELELWCDLEYALGNIDFQKILNWRNTMKCGFKLKWRTPPNIT